MSSNAESDALGKLVLRLMIGVLVLFHGAAKLMNPGSLDFIKGKLTAIGVPDVIAYGVFAGEVVAPVLVVLGIFCRVAGLLIAGNMLVAILLVHTAERFSFNDSGGWALELQGLFLFGAVAIVLLGSGRLALRPD